MMRPCAVQSIILMNSGPNLRVYIDRGEYDLPLFETGKTLVFTVLISCDSLLCPLTCWVVDELFEDLFEGLRFGLLSR